MIPQEWFDKYFEKSGDSKIRPTQYSHSCEHGFATWNVDSESLMVLQLFSKDKASGDWWYQFFSDIIKQTGLKWRFSTRRNPKAWERRCGAKIVGYIMEIDNG